MTHTSHSIARFSATLLVVSPAATVWRVSTPPLSPDPADRELEIELLTELALARAEREGTAVRVKERRWARVRFLLIVLVLALIAGTFIYLTLRSLRSAFGA